MRVAVVLLLLLALNVYTQVCDLAECSQCDFTDPAAPLCLTCMGWYQSGAQSLCVLSARLIILTIVCSLLFIGIVICVVMKIKESYSKTSGRPENIESYPSKVQVSDAELNGLQWKRDQKMNPDSTCGICGLPGANMELQDGKLYHGDCACLEHRNKNKNGRSKLYCLKCNHSYLECDVEWYPQLKKRKGRICPHCLSGKE